MINRKIKNICLSVMAVICCVAVCLAAGTLSGSSRVFALEESIFRADFDNLSAGSTADEIYANTGFAGSLRSIEEGTVYIEAPYSFYDNGCQKNSLYLDSNRGVSSTDVSKIYTFHLEFMDYGLVSSTVLQLQGNSTAIYDSVVTFTPDGKGVISNYGSEQYVKDITAERAEDGWWNVTFTAMGTGGYIFPNFCMNTSDYNTANSEKNTGLRLGGFKVTEGENVIYDLSVTAGLNSGDEIFTASGFAGIAEACTKSSGNRLKAVYTFWSSAEGGWQKDPLYGDENAQNILMEQDMEYRVELDVEPFGKCKDLHIIANAATPGTVDSQVIIHNQQNTAEAVEYKKKIFKSAAVNRDGVWHVTMCINGFGDKFKILFNMLSSDADGANTDKDTGIYLDNYNVYKVAENTPVEPEPESDIITMEGAAIRIKEPYGLRFEAKIDEAELNSVKSLGMYLCPTDLLTNGEFPTGKNLEDAIMEGDDKTTLATTAKFIKKVNIPIDTLAMGEGGKKLARLSLVGIQDWNIDRRFSAMAYIIKNDDTEERSRPIVRSVSYVARLAQENPEPGLSAEGSGFIDGIVLNSNDFFIKADGMSVNKDVKQNGDFSHQISLGGEKEIILSLSERFENDLLCKIKLYAKAGSAGITINGQSVSTDFTEITLENIQVIDNKVTLTAMGTGDLWLDDIRNIK